ncbi:MAG: SpoIIE family protein phosphatase [Candidatus Marinimicrobia bacterium]|nr:SpoIIE family protein phosphatase [Candidatus Neomarinimicrobiota bacterium]MCF7839425.1 SpoIIE family protein phosphatase [Candidatus Neomarinimicrobiota bacterium]
MRWTEQIVSGFILVIILSVWTALVHGVIGFDQHMIWALIVQSTGIVVVFRTLQSGVVKSVLRILAPSYFDRHQRLRQLVSHVREAETYQAMLAEIKEALLDIFNIDVMAIFVKQGSVYRIEAATAPAPIVLEGIQCELDHPLPVTLREDKNYIIPVNYSIEDLALDDQSDSAMSYQSFKLFRYAIPLRTQGLLTGFILVNRIPNEMLTRRLGAAFPQTIDQIAVTLDVKKLAYRLEMEADKKNILATISERMNSSASQAALFNTILDQLDRVMPFDACGVFLTAKDEVTIDKFIQRGYDRRRLNPLKLKIGRGIVGKCIATRKPFLARDIRKDKSYISGRNETRSELCVPIVAGNSCWGAVNLESNRIAAFTLEDQQFLETIATQSGVAMENLDLHSRMIENRFGEDMDRAEQIQRSLLPGDLPNHPEMEFNLQFVPSMQISGDFYDLKSESDQKFLLAIGDVVGKGIPGALLMSNFYAAYQSEIKSSKILGEVMQVLNRQLTENLEVSREITFFLSRVDLERGVLNYVNAGHPPPMIFHRDGTWDRLEVGGPILGADKNADYPVAEVALMKEDLIVLYTDGATEAIDPSRQLFDEQGVIDCVQENLASAVDVIGSTLLERIYQFTKSNLLKDDVTLILARYQPGSN